MQANTQSSQHIKFSFLYWRNHPHWLFLIILSNTIWWYMLGFISRFLILSHWSMYLVFVAVLYHVYCSTFVIWFKILKPDISSFVRQVIFYPWLPVSPLLSHPSDCLHLPSAGHISTLFKVIRLYPYRPCTSKAHDLISICKDPSP